MVTILIGLCFAGALLAALNRIVRDPHQLSPEQEDYYDILVPTGRGYIPIHTPAGAHGMDNDKQLKEIVRYQANWKVLGVNLNLEEAAQQWITNHAAAWRVQHSRT
jgi:hypothetical protein